MTSLPAPLSDFLGDQRPRIYSVPPYVASLGEKAIALASLAGLDLDPWQQLALRDTLGVTEEGKWAAFEAAIILSRQNGKGGFLEARELAGLFLVPDDRLIIHSAHQFDTSLEAFERLAGLILSTPELRQRVRGYRGPDLDPRGISRSHGTEGITLKNGNRIRFRTRTKGGGRGFTCDCLIIDECMVVPDAMLTALMPTLSARPNPQVIYTGSAVDQEIHEYGVVLARIRERGHAGTDPSLAYFEWSATDALEDVTPEMAADPKAWATANPALGIRISPEYIANERRAFGSNVKGFAVERLGVGDWPSTDPGGARIITAADWDACLDENSQIEGQFSFAFDITPDRAWTCISVAGRRADGVPHVEVVEHRRNGRWVVDRIAELAKRHRCRSVFCDAYGPAGSLIPALEDLRIDVVALSAKDVAQACGIFYDATAERTVRHLGQVPLTAAVTGARTTPLGESAWKWSRKSSDVDISPLVSCTTALWGLRHASNPRPRIISLADFDDEEG